VNLDVEIVMACHNYARYLPESLESLTRQTLSPRKIIFIDDGSVDETQGVLASLRPRLPFASELITHDRTRGVAASLNEGMARARAPFVCVLDPDDVFEPALLERCAQALSDNAGAGFAYPRMRLFGEETGIYASYSFSTGRLLFEGNYVPMISMMRREAFEETGGFRQLTTHVDWDMWLSMVEWGWRGVLVDEVLYNWRRHDAAMTAQGARDRTALRLRLLRDHRRLVLRNLHLALPWLAAGAVKRVRSRLPGATVVRSRSAWVERCP
jgi:glycosyltransferase involved in cell wall biosynthesis